MAKLLTFRLFCFPSECRRNILTSAIQCSKQSIQKVMARRSERYMKKTVDLLNGIKSHKDRKWKSSMDGQPLGSGFLSTPQVKPGNIRRAQQLSIVFHEYITSLISSGEVCPELLDHGFQIVKVQMPPDLSSMNIYWLASGSPKDLEVVALLPKCASALRSTLTGLRLTGHVPPIQFCKDLTSARVQRVEELLKIADMGPDFVPSDEIDNVEIVTPVNQVSINQEMQLLAKHFNQQTESELVHESFGPASNLYHGPSSPHSERNDLRCSEKSNAEDLQSAGETLVDEFSKLNLRSDVYGIQHEELKQQILRAKRKLKDRCYRLKSEENAGRKEEAIGAGETSDEFSKTKAFTSEQLGSLKSGTRRKDRLYRNADDILSSVHHLDNDDSKLDTEESFVDDEDYDGDSRTR